MLTTARLTLRPWTPDDAADARALWGSAEVMALLGGPLVDGRAEERMRLEIAAQEQDGLSYWRVGDHTRDHAFLGCCGLRSVRFTSGVTEVEMGFHLLPSAWGRGYATEAARAVVRWAFDVRELDLLHAGHHPENFASRAVLLKLGFQRLPEDRYYPPTGLIHPWYRLPREV